VRENFFSAGHDAGISKKWVTLPDTFGVDVADGEDDLRVLMRVLEAAEADDRSASAATSSGRGLSSLVRGSSSSRG